MTLHPTVQAELSDYGPTDGVPFRARTNHLHTTWARTFSSLPELFIQPQSEAEIAKVLRLARLCHRRVTTTGCGHSPSHLTCTSSWLVNLDHFNAVKAIDVDSGLITVESGIRIYTLCDALDAAGLAMPNLGSINQQSIAGAISTGTHGSSLRHGLMSEAIQSLKIMLADGTVQICSEDENRELFRGALLSLGALGIITEVTLRVVPSFTLKWHQIIDTDEKLFAIWNDELWRQSEFVRVWWMPYTRRGVIWKADKTEEASQEPVRSYYDRKLGYHVYHNLLYLAQFVPRVLPWIEWFVFGLQYGFANGTTATGIQPSRDALLMNCLYSQYVNEWAVPLHKGPETLRRLGSWLNHLTPSDPDYVPPNIPFSADDLYIHSPVEVRVSDTTRPDSNPNTRPYLDNTVRDGPTLYLNALFYRPYLRDPPGLQRYYEAFEWLMRDVGGRPHWAKNFVSRRPEFEAFMGKELVEFRDLRDRVDPDGMFAGPWHRDVILPEGKRLAMEEVELSRVHSINRGITLEGVVRGTIRDEYTEKDR